MDKILKLEDIDNLYDRYKKDYDKYLKEKGVKELKKGKDKISQSLYTILFLLKYQGEKVTKQELTEGWVTFGKPTNDFQSGRHLGLQYGYNIEKSGSKRESWYRLLNLTQPHPSFLPDRRNQEFTESEWIEFKEAMGNRCWSCGAIEGELHYKDKSRVVKLEKGHCNPKLPMTLDNIFPQCNYCNGLYKDNFVFDKRGNVHHQI